MSNMDWMSWFPAITTTALLSLALFLAKNVITTRLKNSVEHEFNQKLEALRSDFRKSEERLKAQLRERDTELSALRSGALSALASRQAALDKRRLEAVDQLWESFNALAPARGIAANLSVIKFASAADQAERDPQVREFFEMIGAGFDPKKLDLSGSNKARPFLSPMVWAIFSAIKSIAMYSVMRWQILKSGLGNKDYADHKTIKNLVVAALPTYSDYLDEHGADSYYYVLEALDQRLLSEIQSMLAGVESDKASLEQAAEIVRQASALQAETREAETHA